MRASYRAVCVKFREDDPVQMQAWEYLRTHGAGKSYSALIAEAVAVFRREYEAADLDGSRKAIPALQGQMNRMEQMLLEVRSICMAIRDDAGRSDSPEAGVKTDTYQTGGRENEQREDKYRNTVLDFALGMGGEV